MTINNSLNLGITPLPPTQGGTGIANAITSTLTLGGATEFSGAFTFKGIITGSTTVTFPTSGTLATTAGTVSSVSGTASRITSSGGTTPVIDIDAAYVGQSSITTLGTIATGAWNGSVIGLAYGGTNKNLTPVAGGVVFTDSDSMEVTAAGTSGQVLTSAGAGTPTWTTPTTGTVTSVSGTTNRITSTGGATPVIDISGSYVGQSSITTLGTIGTGVWGATPVTVPFGGTGNTTFTAYSVICAGTTATGTFQNVSGLGTSGHVLTSNGAGALPTWQAASGGVTSVSGTAGRITSSGGATPVIDIDAAYVGQASIVTVGTITTGAWDGTDIPVTAGGTGVSTMTTAYAPVISGTTATGALQVASTGLATAGFVLTSNGASAVPSFQAAGSGTVTSVSGTADRITVATGTTTPVIDIAATYVGQSSITTLGTIATGVWNGTPVTVPYGGTGNTTFTAYSVICAGTTSTGVFQNVSGVGTSGQVLTSQGAGALPQWAAAGGGGGGLTFANIAGTSQAAAVNTKYLVSNAGQTTITLPATAAAGDEIEVVGLGAGGWVLTANSGQTINMGALATSTAGSITSANRYDKIQVMCVVANTTWNNVGSVSAGLTVT